MAELRAIDAGEARTFLETTETAFGQGLRDDDFEQMARVLEPDRSLAAFDGETMVGTAGAYTMTMSVPGGEVPVAAVTMVGVLPTHRRRGILRALMNEQLQDFKRRAEPVAVLWASEPMIYPRFGYGLASLQMEIAVARMHARWAADPGPAGKTRLLGREEALKTLPAVYETARASVPGMLSRTETWWDAHRMHDLEHSRGGAGPLFRVLVEIDGSPAGYALYRTKADWSERVPGGTVQVLEAIATSLDATRDLWRYLFGIDLTARIKALWQPVDTPLLLMLDDPNRLNAVLHDGLWVRVVDVPAALAARSYAAPGAIRLQVADSLCEWNDGVWELEPGPPARVTRTSEPPDLVMGISDLGAAYLGGFSWTRLVAAGRVAEAVPGAAARADALWRWDHAPYCPEVF